MAIGMKRGLKETIHLVTIELIKKCNYRVSMLGKPANIKYWLFCHTPSETREFHKTYESQFGEF